MKPLKPFCIGIFVLLLACGKKSSSDTGTTTGQVTDDTETAGGITYRLFIKQGQTAYTGILIMGSGNDESNPTPGSLDESTDVDLCTKAAQNNYIAAIVQYSQTPGLADWNGSANTISQDYDKCISVLSSKYGVDKSRSVVGGYSYASFMLLTGISINTTLSYCKGVLAPCGATGQWNAQNFTIPIYAIACSGNNEGDYSGQALYDQIPANSPIKAQSAGVTDNSCNTHCGGDWTDQLYTRLTTWLP